MKAQLLVHLSRGAVLCAALIAGHGGACAEGPAARATLARRTRHPAALAFVDGGKTLVVANRRSGTLSVIHTKSRTIVAECAVGRGLSDLGALSDGRHLLAIDQFSHDVLLIDACDDKMEVVDRIKVSPDPVRIIMSADGSSGIVASLWSRRLTFIRLARRAAADLHPVVSIVGALDLPFSPREMALVSASSRAIVADAFGGRLAVVNIGRRSVESVRSVPAHNIRGLALAPNGQALVVAHQVLSRLAQSSFDDVHWGLLIRNHLRVLRTDSLMKPGPDVALLEGSRLFDLGDVGNAAGDPGDIAFDARGNLLVALTGVDEVAITTAPDQRPRRIGVGRQPTAVVPSPDGSLAYVANTLDDTIAVIDIATGLRPATIDLGPRPEPTAAERGERLFSSARLSHDGWMSCHSCHSDGHTNSLVSDTLGDGSYGAPKRIPSLLGVATTGPWNWTGSMARLEDQVRTSITTTMRGPGPTEDQVADLTAYLRSLSPPSPEVIDRRPVDSPAVTRGRAVYESRKCASCHVPPDYTSPERFDVGLVDTMGNHMFNPPSLRGVGRRDAFLHDGRAKSLEDVFEKVRHPRGHTLTSPEIGDLVEFLKGL